MNLLTPEQVADRLNIAKGTLFNLRSKGQAPPAIKVGGSIRYRENDLNTWIQNQPLDK